MQQIETFALSIMVVFGALIIGGLMAAGLLWSDRPAFLFALAASLTVWVSSFAVLFDKPRIYGVMLFFSGCLVAASITALVT